MKAIITGASSGLGREFARCLSARGASLILTARREDRLEELKKELGGDVKTVVCDLTERDSVFALCDAVKDEDADILINNAGFGLVSDFLSSDLDTELEMIETNAVAPHILTKVFYRRFAEKGSGRILNVASSSAFMPAGPYFSSYYATKSYLYTLTRSVAKEAREHGVRISVLCPGPIKTEFDGRAGVSKSLKGLDARTVAEYAIGKFLKGKELIVPGADIRLLKFATRLLPDRASIFLTERQQKKKLR